MKENFLIRFILVWGVFNDVGVSFDELVLVVKSF